MGDGCEPGCDHGDITKADTVLVQDIHVDSGLMVGWKDGQTHQKYVITLHAKGSSVLIDDEGMVQIDTTKLLMIDLDDAYELVNQLHDGLIALRVRMRLHELGVNTDGMDL